MNNFNMWKQGAKDGLPIFMGYVAVSFTFGIAARNVLNPFYTVLMSATNYTSAGQFAALGLIAVSASFWEMAAVQLVINLRYCLMSCCISQKLEKGVSAWHRFVMAMGVTDEVFGLSVAVKGDLRPSYVYGVMSTALPGWVLGTFLGVMSSGFMPPQVMSAMGIAIYGMFIAIIFPPAKENHKLGGIIAVSMAGSFLFDQMPAVAGLTPGLKIILLTVVVAGGAAVLFPVDGKKSGVDADDEDSLKPEAAAGEPFGRKAASAGLIPPASGAARYGEQV